MIQVLYSYISKENHEHMMKGIVPIFSDDFQQKVFSYRRWQDAQLSILGRVLVIKGLKKLNKSFLAENLRYNEYNKPYLAGENIKFNISHSGDIVVCVITENFEIGIDIEILQDIEIEDFKSQMTDNEWKRVLSSQCVKTSFFNYWTQKEAVIKAHGMGLYVPLKSFEILNNQTKIGDDCFFLKEIYLDTKYKCHIALKNKRIITINKPLLGDTIDLQF